MNKGGVHWKDENRGGGIILLCQYISKIQRSIIKCINTT